ncbi:LOW QUALITY PROTEIN: uncharacterized protein LOC129320600 [Prosopis cineraria]|uniref:LOW QUALITY PROTEIN: uncharacterized protein LOC129320600 n=1 Tax=Prosopis cineraria TaxID=364024 RepID=UPI0024109E41|nr:LOW QUALITY PROTEIN: uncharacterized protein LOC129320600 [Prosopis cineraria]
MAGGNPQNKSSLPKPPPPQPSSASSSHRKSRWESTSNASKKSPASDPRSGESKNPKPSTAAPSPKTKPTPSPAHAKHHPSENLTHQSAGSAARAPSPGAPFPFPDLASLGPPPTPAYGFHMLERRTIVLADGSVRSYFALPPDYPLDPPGRLFPPPLGPGFDPGRFGTRFLPDHITLMIKMEGVVGGTKITGIRLVLMRGGGPVEGSAKRKFVGDEVERDDLARQRKQLLHDANVNPNGFPPRGEFSRGISGPFKHDLMDPGRESELRASKYMRVGGAYENVGFRQSGGIGDNVALKHLEVDQDALKKAFLQFVKLVNENVTQKRNYLEDGKHGRIQCVACGRSSKDFPDMHALIMHTYNSDNADLRVDHLGLHKALCVLMGWNYSKPPDNSKAYQFLPADEAAANRDDLILWPPMVIIHNTITGKGRDGRMEGLGNKTMDNKVRELGIGGGKSKSLYGREGHLGISLIKFAGDQSGVCEAIRLAEHFEKENHGRKVWARVQPPALLGKDDENNPNLVKYDEKKGEKRRILYGYLGTAFDLEKIDFDTRKRVVIESLRDKAQPSR